MIERSIFTCYPFSDLRNDDTRRPASPSRRSILGIAKTDDGDIDEASIRVSTLTGSSVIRACQRLKLLSSSGVSVVNSRINGWIIPDNSPNNYSCSPVDIFFFVCNRNKNVVSYNRISHPVYRTEKLAECIENFPPVNANRTKLENAAM